MFPKIVSNLSITPQAVSQLAFYGRRLAQEDVTRKLSAVFALLLIALQITVIAAPPTPANAAGPNDIITGGFVSKTDFLADYDARTNAGANLRALLSYFGISRTDVVASQESQINSSDHTLLSLGRTPHAGDVKTIICCGGTFYLRPLYVWDTTAYTLKYGSTYKALVGTRAVDHGFFALMNTCGNIVVRSIPAPPAAPAPKPVASPTPPPRTTVATPLPSAPPVVYQPPPVVPVAVTPPQISQHKSALNLTQLTVGVPTDATTVTAQPGDTIQYTLTTSNTGGSTQTGYVIQDNITDITDYANVVDLGGATRNTDGYGQITLSWPPQDIAAGATATKQFTVKVMDPVPTTNQNQGSFDLKMDNVYGNALSVPVAAPPAKVVEETSQNLPQTGAGTDALVVFAFGGLVMYFWARNRQLLAEVKILRHEYHGGTS